ncbi:MAG TPA: FHA domain-containing protein, partial [Gemmataceae bacterium]|nr:FHA domain-containing protein [Gemmataceae bacterium]
MKLRLSIADQSGRATFFDLPGPVVRIGRDPVCEVPLAGADGSAVSRQHAQVNLSADGATIADTGSSNGTLLNGSLIESAVPLRAGDRIQLGYTGPALTVVELDLGTAPPSGAAPARRAVLLGSLAAVGLGAVVLLLVIALRKPAQPDERVEESPPVTPGQARARETGRIQPRAPARPEAEKPQPPRAAPPGPPHAGMGSDVPSEEVKQVGSYVALAHWVSVLVQRQGEAHPWSILRPEARVATGHTLVSLPGYRSLIALDGGLQLTLWGNLPEFSASPPVLESVVMLHAPSPRTDLDFTLDRGRVVVTNRKEPAASARVRLRFLREDWELELPDASSEVGVELWTRPGGAAAGAAAQPPAACLGLFALKGRVRVRARGKSFDLDKRRLSWINREPTKLYRAELPASPDWWARPPDKKTPAVQKAMLSLLEWSDRLGGSTARPPKGGAPAAAVVAETIKTHVGELKDPDDQDLGVFFLAALEQTKLLVLCLGDRQNPDVRGSALFALQSWLGRGGQHAEQLAGILENEGHGFSKDKAERIVGLLRVY